MNLPSGTIYLIPTPLNEDDASSVAIPYNHAVINKLRLFVVEELRTARRFLRKVNPDFPIDDCQFYILNEHTIATIDFCEILKEANGKNIGLMSEAGLPCVADPGSEFIALAHTKDIRVIPLVGASSIFMTLMASGLGGQRFAFHGYLPTDKTDLTTAIRKLEQQSRTERQTQIFMETPYRNMQLLEMLLKYCRAETLLCIACNISKEEEYIKTKTIAEWKKSTPPLLHKKPTVFAMALF